MHMSAFLDVKVDLELEFDGLFEYQTQKLLCKSDAPVQESRLAIEDYKCAHVDHISSPFNHHLKSLPYTGILEGIIMIYFGHESFLDSCGTGIGFSLPLAVKKL